MFEKFRNWYTVYQNEITWWIIGWCSFGTVDCLIKGNYGFAAFNALLVYFNYKMWKDHV